MINQSSIEGTTPLPANIAYTNASNLFTENQRIWKTIPRIAFSDTSQPVDARKWEILALNQNLYFHSINDAENISYGSMNLSRTGNLVLSGSFNCATPVKITGSAPILTFYDTAVAANTGKFRIINSAQCLYLQAIADDDVSTSGYIRIDRGGSLVVLGSIQTVSVIYPGRVDITATQASYYLGSHATYGLYSNTGMYFEGSVVSAQSVRASTYCYALSGFQERSRATFVGDWVAHTPSMVAGGSITGVTTSKYCLIGKTCIYLYHFTVNIPSATTYLQWYIPVTANGYVTNPAMASTTPCIGYTWPGYNTMFTMRDTSQVQAFPSGSYYLSGIIIIPFD